MKIRVLVAASACALVLSGCAGQSHVGSALVVDGKSVSTKEVNAQVDEIRNEIQMLPVGTIENTPSIVMLTRMVVDRAITSQLVELALQKQGITISDDEVQTFADGIYAQYGKGKILIQIMGSNGVSSSQVDKFMRLVYAENVLAKKLSPELPEAEQTQALIEYVGAISNEVGVEVSPRFGTWEPTQLQVSLGDSTLSYIEKEAQELSY